MKQQPKPAPTSTKPAASAALATPAASAAVAPTPPAAAPAAKPADPAPAKKDWKGEASRFEKELKEAIALVDQLKGGNEKLITDLTTALGQKDEFKGKLESQNKELGDLRIAKNRLDQLEKAKSKSVAVTGSLLALWMLLLSGVLFWRMPSASSHGPNVVMLQSQLEQVTEKVTAAATAGASQAKLTATSTLTDEQKSDLVRAIKGAWSDKDIAREALVGYDAIMQAHPPHDNISGFVNGILDLVLAPGGIKVDGGSIVTSMDEKTGALSMEFKELTPPVAKQ